MTVYIQDIAQHAGQSVTLKGWLHNRRSSGKIHFLTLRDGTGFIQCVMSRQAVGDEAFKAADHLAQETSIIVDGTVRADARAPGGYEVDATRLQVVSESQNYPISPKEHGVDFLMDRRHLWIRSQRQQAILRVRHEVINGVRDFFNERGFILADTPIFTPAACEGTTTLFPVQYFDDETAYLTQSGQLYNEANAMALGRVYCFGPTFRAEKSKTRRHLTEFWMVEPEIAFADLSADADLAESFLKYILRALLDERGDDMKFFAERIDKECITRVESFINSSFERMTYTDAITALEKAVAGGRKFEFPVKWGIDLQTEHERYLTEELVGKPVVVMNYPKTIKAFYMRLNDDERTVAAMDVLAPGIGEIIGGSQREERLDVLDRRMQEMHLDPKAYWWYRDLRRYGSVPHAGFGLGFERTIMYATGMANVRDVIPFPRTPNNAEF
jgi:asparaginyl-tRNA synthetase